jgi:6-phosphogluconate dehydrogenase
MAAQFGMIGLGTMGRNLLLNIADHGIAACGYDRDPGQQQRMKDEAKDKPIQVATSMKEFVEMLDSPKRIMMLVPAGKIVDAVIDEILPFLKSGDILIDGGNSHFVDTDKRIERLKTTGIHFTGMGVSGGEEGARNGPSLMPGGNPDGYAELKSILEKIAAQTEDGPCVTFIGNGSAGHYTKMVHNGIEYAMMQLISEVYAVLKHGGLSNEELQEVFLEWDKAELQSFLIQITATVLKRKEDSGIALVDLVLDKAKQKGTGMWTSQSAMDLNVPLPTIDAAVSMRYLSSLKDERTELSKLYPAKEKSNEIEKGKLIAMCRNSLHFGFVISYAQGLHLLKVASETYKYGINISEVIRIWKGGCIIRSAMLHDLQKAYQADTGLSYVIGSTIFRHSLSSNSKIVAELLNHAMTDGTPMASLSASLQYFDAFRSERLPANLIQAQRDYFGAHTYERLDKPGSFHTDWD